MQVTFTGHAGFFVESHGSSVIVDPWFFSSTFENPILHGLLPPNRTIDFMLPEGFNRIEEFTPDAIVVSHFHTHHAPIAEIRTLIQQSRARKVFVATPALSSEGRGQILENLGDCREQVILLSVENGFVAFTVGEILVIGTTSTWPDHAVWFFQSPTGSFLHIADARANSNPMSRELDPSWSKFQDLRPAFLAITTAGHCLKRVRNEQKWIYENSTCSPVEGARLVQLIKPKMAATMGIFNHSIWKNRAEYSLPADFVEDSFRWAVHYLEPEVRCHTLRPGDKVDLSCDWKLRELFKPRPLSELMSL